MTERDYDIEGCDVPAWYYTLAIIGTLIVATGVIWLIAQGGNA